MLYAEVSVTFDHLADFFCVYNSTRVKHHRELLWEEFVSLFEMQVVFYRSSALFAETAAASDLLE
jgi:hypothetical protein